jgi:hypothetical protein
VQGNAQGNAQGNGNMLVKVQFTSNWAMPAPVFVQLAVFHHDNFKFKFQVARGFGWTRRHLI